MLMVPMGTLVAGVCHGEGGEPQLLRPVQLAEAVLSKAHHVPEGAAGQGVADGPFTSLCFSLAPLGLCSPSTTHVGLVFYSHGLFDGRRHGAGMSSAIPAAVIIPTASTGNATRAVTEQWIRKTPLSYMELLGPLTPGSPFTASPDLESGPARVWGDGSVGVLVSVFVYLRYAPPTGKRKLC